MSAQATPTTTAKTLSEFLGEGPKQKKDKLLQGRKQELAKFYADGHTPAAILQGLRKVEKIPITMIELLEIIDPAKAEKAKLSKVEAGKKREYDKQAKIAKAAHMAEVEKRMAEETANSKKKA